MAFKWYQSKREENLTHKLTVAPKELTRGKCRQFCRCLKKEYRYTNSAFMHWRFYKEPNANIFRYLLLRINLTCGVNFMSQS